MLELTPVFVMTTTAHGEDTTVTVSCERFDADAPTGRIKNDENYKVFCQLIRRGWVREHKVKIYYCPEDDDVGGYMSSEFTLRSGVLGDVAYLPIPKKGGVPYSEVLAANLTFAFEDLRKNPTLTLGVPTVVLGGGSLDDEDFYDPDESKPSWYKP